MDRQAATVALLIAVLITVAWFADRISRLPLTWQTILAVSATLLVIILALIAWLLASRGKQ